MNVDREAAEQILLSQVLGLAVAGPLAVVDTEAAIFVVLAEDQQDWLVRFEKDGQFPAAEWAHHMVDVYNDRLRRGDTGDRWQARPPGMHLDG